MIARQANFIQKRGWIFPFECIAEFQEEVFLSVEIKGSDLSLATYKNKGRVLIT
jgi:hypothetical protein